MGMDAINNVAAAASTNYQPPKPVAPAPETVSVENVVAPAEGMPSTQTVQATPQQQAGTQQQDGQTEQKQKQPTQDEIKNAISHANKRAHFGNTSAQFSYHEKTKRISVKILDKDTNEVIKEIPPEETLDMIAKMYELAGIMIDEKR